MIEVSRTGELEGFVKFFYGSDWEKDVAIWAKKDNVTVVGTYYKQIVGKGIIVSYHPKKKEEIEK